MSIIAWVNTIASSLLWTNIKLKYQNTKVILDGDVLKKFIECNNTKVYIYYLDEVDRANKIRNLAVILGRDKLIELTSGENPIIVFETDGNY